MADELIAENTPSTGDVTPAAATPQPAADQGTAPKVEGQQQQATEGQTAPQASDKPAEGEKAEGDQGKPQGAPEKYEFKAPEGTQFNEQVLTAYSEVAKELNLPQEAAQKVLDKVAPVIAASQLEAIKTVQNEWIASTKADKEFGGEKIDANIAVAKKALDTFGTPALVKLLNETGLGNHPEMIRAFYRAGKAISEDKHVSGSAAPGGRKDAASVLYPNQQ